MNDEKNTTRTLCNVVYTTSGGLWGPLIVFGCVGLNNNTPNKHTHFMRICTYSNVYLLSIPKNNTHTLRNTNKHYPAQLYGIFKQPLLIGIIGSSVFSFLLFHEHYSGS